MSNADSFGYGPCQAPTQYLACSQAAINDSGLCRWHYKVGRHLPTLAEVAERERKAKVSR